MAIVFGLASGSLADAQQVPDPRVHDIVQSGKIRLALFLPGYTKSPAGEVRGSGTGAVAVELARALAARLGIQVQLIEHPKPPQVVVCLKAHACDLAYMGVDPSRAAEVGFSLPFMQQDFTYLVPAGSPIRSVADADRRGVRIAVVRDHAATIALTRSLKNAETIPFDVPSAAFEAIQAGRADTWASARFGLLQSAGKLPGSRVLEDRYGANFVALAVPKDRIGRLAYVSEFVEEAKASGLVQRAIDGAGLRGYQVVLPKKPN